MSSVDFLFTPTVQRVLGTTLAQPGRSFTLQELMRRAGTGRGSAQIQINRLVKAGVLTEGQREGNQRRIRANTAFFLYPELRSIAMKTFGLIGPIRVALEEHAPGVQEAFIFGSVAKGSDSEKSDIDLMVIGTFSSQNIYKVTSVLMNTLGRDVHVNAYEPDEWAHLVATDPVVSQIANGPRLRVFPNDDDATN